MPRVQADILSEELCELVGFEGHQHLSRNQTLPGGSTNDRLRCRIHGISY